MYKCLFPTAKKKKTSLNWYVCAYVYVSVSACIYGKKVPAQNRNCVLCVCMCLCMICASVSPFVDIHGSQSLTWDDWVVFFFFDHFSPCFWGRVCSPDLQLADWLDWKASRCWRWLCLWCPSSGVRVTCLRPWLCIWALEVWTQIPPLAWQALY